LSIFFARFQKINAITADDMERKMLKNASAHFPESGFISKKGSSSNRIKTTVIPTKIVEIDFCLFFIFEINSSILPDK
jgi:hypothetical protein